MRAILALVVSSFMLNMSVHAGSATQFSSKTPPDAKKNIEGYEREWKKQEMEDIRKEEDAYKRNRGFEKNPRPYSPDSTPQERIQTED